MSQIDSRLVSGFWDEARGYLPPFAACLDTLTVNREDRGALEELHRLAHSIRGASTALGEEELGALAQSAEDLAEAINKGDVTLDDESLELFRDALSRMRVALGEETAPQAAAKPAPAPDIIIEDVSPELLESFVQEAEELLQNVDGRLRQLEHNSTRKDLVLEVRRSVHTIKGAAGMVGLGMMGKLAHRMEDLLDEIYEGSAQYTPDVHSLLVYTYDTLCDMLSSGGKSKGKEERISQLMEAYSKFVAQPEVASKAVAASSAQEAEADDAQADEVTETAGQQADPVDPGRYIRVPIERLDELARLVGELFVSRSSLERYLAGYRHEVDELDLSLRRLKRISSRFESDYASMIPSATTMTGWSYAHASPGAGGGSSSGGGRGPDRSDFDALEFDRYGEFHLLSRDLVEATSDVVSAEDHLADLAGDFDTFLNRQGRLTAELQDRIMRIRLVPLSSVASRLHRTVRVAAQKTGKQVDLVISGTSTELDKTVIEQLIGPLEHILRNSVDHGVESPSVRVNRGKSPRGRILLSAAVEGTQVVVRVRDDGGGIDTARVRQAALQRGLINETEAASMNDKAAYQLIFQPGFSTAESVTEISGRGVGLDIVHSSVLALNGSISVESVMGEGTEFHIRLPISLSITRVLMVEANQELFAIPLMAVNQVARVPEERFEQFGAKQVVRIEKEVLPVNRLGQVLSLPKPSAPGSGRSPVIVLQVGEVRSALVVDRIVEAREVMVKNPEGVLKKSPAIAGATLLGDGSIVLILNPAELLASKPSSRIANAARNAMLKRALDVLIVDDSLSVRRVMTNLVKNQGWAPLAAKDGVEAIEVLQRSSRPPDVILMDVEMPRMDGYELTTTLRAQKNYKNTPIIMITSRAGEKHRNKAFAAGVNEFLVKPFQEDELISMVRSCLAKGKVN